MKKEAIVYLILLLTITGCLYLEAITLLQDQRIATHRHEISTNPSFALEVNGNIYLKAGDQPELIIEGPEKILKALSVTIDDSDVSIKSENMLMNDGWKSMFLRPQEQLNIYITLPAMDDLTIDGMGGLLSTIERETDEIYIQSFGFGEIVIEDIKLDSSKAYQPALLSKLLQIGIF